MKTPLVRQAVLLVGGRGTRLWPLTAKTPKPLLPVAGVAFLDLQLRLLAEVGCEEVILAVSRGQEVAWHAFAELHRRPHLKVSVENMAMDTAGPLSLVKGLLDERFLVLNGDVILETSPRDFVTRAPDLPAVLSLVEVPDPGAYGVVVTEPDGLVRAFIEKPLPGQTPVRTVNAGMYLLQKRALASYPEGPLSFERVVFPDLVERGQLGAVVVEGAWLDIGTAELYLATHQRVLAGGSRLVSPVSAHLVEPEAEVAGALRGAWSYIGPKAVIEAGAVVEEAVVLDRARIRTGAVVKGAVVGWEAEVKANAVVTDAAMVGEGAVIGEGCELAAGVRIAPRARLSRGAISFRPPA